MSPTRAERRLDIERRIIEVGRHHLVEHGAAALSLRAVARDLGMVSSAVYRYVANRDDLLTLLVVDAYTDLADTVDAAAATGGAWDARLLAAGVAFRGWAARDPSRYALLYGSPVPGYEAPAERTTGPGTRVVALLTGLVADGVAHGDIPRVGDQPVADPGLAAALDDIARELGPSVGADVMARASTLWAVLVGATSLEMFGQYGADSIANPAALFEHQLRLALGLLRH